MNISYVQKYVQIGALHEGENISEICPERISFVPSQREKDLKGLVNDFNNSKMAAFRTDGKLKFKN